MTGAAPRRTGRRPAGGLRGLLLRLGRPRSIDPERLATEQHGAAGVTQIHPALRGSHALPANVTDRHRLSAAAGAAGFALRDVPTRQVAATRLLRLRDIRIAACLDGDAREFAPALFTARGRALDLAQLGFRSGHAALLRGATPPLRLPHGTWILEHGHDNHARWLTAHLPKLLLLQRRGLLGGLILPARRGRAIDASLAMLGIDPAGQPVLAAGQLLEVADLTVVTADPFHPELLHPLRDALRPAGTGAADRRVYISRARRRDGKLANEDLLWPELRAAGFEKVHMEDLDFAAQVRLMSETAVLLAPQGAGLANMIFCPEGADIVEIADPDRPDPFGYALATAMGHRFWWLAAQPTAAGARPAGTLLADIAEVKSVLRRIGARRAADRPQAGAVPRVEEDLSIR